MKTSCIGSVVIGLLSLLTYAAQATCIEVNSVNTPGDEPGKIMSFDLNGDHVVVRESNRLQIRIVLSGDTSRGLVSSTEVFENDTGKTTVFIGNPDI